MNLKEQILSRLNPYGYFTWYDIWDYCGDIKNKNKDFDKTLLGLVEAGKVLTAQVTDGKHRGTLVGYKLPPKEEK